MTVTIVLIPLLVLAVIFVNGWTDAPNAIATAVGSGALSFRKAALLAAVCNFLGTALSCLLFPAVAMTMSGLVTFGGGQAALTALCAAMLAIVLWATAAWLFGLPTSESHALMAGLAGATLALGGSMAQLNGRAWTMAVGGMILSLPAGFLAGRVLRCPLKKIPHNAAAWQRRAAALMALLHGGQDGQKFMALLLMVEQLSGETSIPPAILALTAAGVMSIGTALGGRPIVEKVGTDLVVLTPSDGLAADLGAGAVLTVCSLLGLPVSTTHAKVSAVCGAGRKPNPRAAGQMVGAWLLTFPCCGLLAFLLTRMML